MFDIYKYLFNYFSQGISAHQSQCSHPCASVLPSTKDVSLILVVHLEVFHLIIKQIFIQSWSLSCNTHVSIGGIILLITHILISWIVSDSPWGLILVWLLGHIVRVHAHSRKHYGVVFSWLLEFNIWTVRCSTMYFVQFNILFYQAQLTLRLLNSHLIRQLKRIKMLLALIGR